MKNKSKDVSEIGNRAKTILAEVIEVYLRQGTPVSSKLISEEIISEELAFNSANEGFEEVERLLMNHTEAV